MIAPDTIFLAACRRRGPAAALAGGAARGCAAALAGSGYGAPAMTGTIIGALAVGLVIGVILKLCDRRCAEADRRRRLLGRGE